MLIGGCARALRLAYRDFKFIIPRRRKTDERTMSIICFELVKLVLTYLLIKLIFELIDIASTFIRLLLLGISRGLEHRDYYVYPHARFVKRKLETCVICLGSGTDVMLQCGH